MFYEVWPLWVNYDSTYFVESNEKFLVWDITLVNQEPFLIFSTQKNWKQIDWKLEYKGNLFTPRTVFFQKFLSNYWYSWYFKFFKLFIQDSKYVLKYELPKIKRFKFEIKWTYVSEYKNFDNYFDYLKMWDNTIETINLNDFSENLLSDWQNLFVFPDMWSLYNFYKNSKIEWKIIDVNSTSLTRFKHYLNIKNWKYKNIFTTHWWVFQDWKKLKSIFIFFPYKWYYKNQQNPRYWLPELAKQIKFFYEVKNLYYIF